MERGAVGISRSTRKHHHHHHHHRRRRQLQKKGSRPPSTSANPAAPGEAKRGAPVPPPLHPPTPSEQSAPKIVVTPPEVRPPPPLHPPTPFVPYAPMGVLANDSPGDDGGSGTRPGFVAGGKRRAAPNVPPPSRAEAKKAPGVCDSAPTTAPASAAAAQARTHSTYSCVPLSRSERDQPMPTLTRTSSLAHTATQVGLLRPRHGLRPGWALWLRCSRRRTAL